VPVPSLARWLLGLGIAATLTANMAQGWSHGPVGAMVAAWPTVSLGGSYELLVWLIRTSGTVEGGPSAQPACNGVACRAVVRAASTVAVDGALSGRSRRNASGQTREPGGPAGRQPASHTIGQRHDAVPEAGAVNDAAVAAYRLSVQAGNRCRNESSPRCSGVHPAAGRAPGSPRRSKYCLRVRRGPSTSHEPLTSGSARLPRLGGALMGHKFHDPGSKQAPLARSIALC
jgi:hypothetical protein